jgi:Uma2 family endonuclease
MNGEAVAGELSLPLFRFSVERYHAMRDAGIFGDDDGIELLEGLLVAKMTKKPLHTLATTLTRQALEASLPAGFFVSGQEPVTTDDSEPEPDVFIVRGAARDYGDRHPGPADVVLVVEVADDSLQRDRGVKLRLYARAGITPYWIVNLRTRTVEVYTRPEGETYLSRVDHGAGAAIALTVDARELGPFAVDDVLP